MQVFVFAHINAVAEFVTEALVRRGVHSTQILDDLSFVIIAGRGVRSPSFVRSKVVFVIDRGATTELQEHSNSLALLVRQQFPTAPIVRIGSENDFPPRCCDRFWSKAESGYNFDSLAEMILEASERV